MRNNKERKEGSSGGSKQEGQGQLLKRLVRDKDSFYNLGMMMVCWVSTTFTYFLVIFLVKYLPGNLYMN
jgi:hypothetical protein